MAQKTALKTLLVDVYSDIACPWCYVGKKKFALARDAFLKSNPGCQVVVNWHPYMIDPATKKMGEDYMAYNVRRWGGDGWTHELRAAGSKVGCNFGNWKIWPNTFLAHCVVTAAQKVGKAEDALNEIFTLCYEMGENVSDPKVLAKVAAKFAVSDADWKSEAIQKAVLEDDRNAKEDLDIHGVPYFVFEKGKAVLEGAHDSASFGRVLNKLFTKA